jgi:beta-xylosidase
VNTFGYSPDGGTTVFQRGNGYDNSVFTDPDSGKTYMLIKSGSCKWNGDAANPNNFGINLVTEIDPAAGMLLPETTIDLSFVNWDHATGGCGDEASGYDTSKWAEGPTMVKRGEWYYYFVTSHTACGGQMGAWASRRLVGSGPQDWTWLGFVLTGVDPYSGVQHATAPFELRDGTWWVFAHSYDCTGWATQGEWLGLAREGLLLQVTWSDTDVPGAGIIPIPHYTTAARDLPAPRLTRSEIPFLLPVNDDFRSSAMGSAWTSYDRSADRYSVADRPGWLRIRPGAGNTTWVVQKDALRSSALVVKMEFKPAASGDAAGVRVGNGYWQDDQVLGGPTWIQGQGFLPAIFDLSMARAMENGTDVIRFVYRSRAPVPTSEASYTALADPQLQAYSVPAPARATLWLKLVRTSAHKATGWFSTDRLAWKQVGGEIDVRAMDDFYGMGGTWVGGQAGMFATGKNADFDLFTYRDGFTSIAAAETNQQFGTRVVSSAQAGSVLGDLQAGDWAMYGSLDLGSGGVSAKAVELTASSVSGGKVEIWLDPLAGGGRAADCTIPATGDWEKWKTIRCPIGATGTHDVYLKVAGATGRELLRLASLRFVAAR